MKARMVLGLAVAMCVVGLTRAADRPESSGSADLDRFKQLVGDWTGTATMHGNEMPASINYRLTSGGHAVVETEFPGTPHEMTTVITQDGDGLALTHYCHLNNQPHMKAKGGADGKVAFKFEGAGNLKSDKDPHMHEVTYTFVDKDTLKAEWTLYQDGKPSGSAVMELKRKK